MDLPTASTTGVGFTLAATTVLIPPLVVLGVILWAAAVWSRHPAHDRELPAPVADTRRRGYIATLVALAAGGLAGLVYLIAASGTTGPWAWLTTPAAGCLVYLVVLGAMQWRSARPHGAVRTASLDVREADHADPRWLRWLAWCTLVVFVVLAALLAPYADGWRARMAPDLMRTSQDFAFFPGPAATGVMGIGCAAVLGLGLAVARMARHRAPAPGATFAQDVALRRAAIARALRPVALVGGASATAVAATAAIAFSSLYFPPGWAVVLPYLAGALALVTLIAVLLPSPPVPSPRAPSPPVPPPPTLPTSTLPPPVPPAPEPPALEPPRPGA